MFLSFSLLATSMASQNFPICEEDRREGGFRAAPSNVVTRALYAAGGKLIVTSEELLRFVENSTLAYTKFKSRYLRFQCCHDFSDGRGVSKQMQRN